jgi:POT family proton-dependent oligopeptide transporter
LLQFPEFTNEALTYVGVFLLAWLVYLAFRLESQERRQMLALIILIATSIVYWGLFSEMFFAVNLFTDRVVDRHIGGFEIPAVAFIASESVFIILLGPLLAKLWERTHQKSSFMTTPYKFAYALLIMGLALQLLVFATHHVHSSLVHPIWIIVFYLLVTCSEMLLSPIGLAMITALSPKKYSGMMMGVWFIALGYGGAVSGYLAKDASIPESIHNVQQMLPIYEGAFQHFANLAYVCFILLFVFSRLLNQLMSSKAEN